MGIYFDHAATSFPKPATVIDSIYSYLQNIGANPGRSAYRSCMAASRIVFQARQNLAKLFNITDERQISFTPNVTEALNIAIMGLLQDGDHVVTSSIEHNSVMRPLRFLEKIGRITLTVVGCNPNGQLNPQDIIHALRDNTKMVILNHASNVCGTILPIEEVSVLLPLSVILLVDSAQTAGILDIDVAKQRIDVLAFTGHKSLLGPMGTGGLYLRPGLSISPLKRGGTGSASDSEEQPEFLPDALESGTLNMPGIAGLDSALQYLQQETLQKIRSTGQELLEYARNVLCEIDEVTIYPKEAIPQMPTFSIEVGQLPCSQVSMILDRRYDMMTRPGLHCSPATHKTIGTFPKGTVRISLGYSNTKEEIDVLVKALKEILATRMT